MHSYEKLLLENKAWAQEKVTVDPDYFNRLAHIQTPEFLWIGCSDSRVPANEITGTQPGEIFVHRNVANLVVNTDVNLLSVLDYAVNHLKVKHVIVCGHYGCGGIKASTTKTDFKLVLNMWLRNIKDVIRIHQSELDAIGDEDKKVRPPGRTECAGAGAEPGQNIHYTTGLEAGPTPRPAWLGVWFKGRHHQPRF